MISVDILYIIIGTCTVVLTVAIVWLVNESIVLVKLLQKSAKNTETISEELKQKTLMVSEALDRVGTVAARVIGFVEDMEHAVEERAGAIASGLGVLAGAKKYFTDKEKKQSKEEPVDEEEKIAPSAPEEEESEPEPEAEEPEEEKPKEKVTDISRVEKKKEETVSAPEEDGSPDQSEDAEEDVEEEKIETEEKIDEVEEVKEDKPKVKKSVKK
ncbi:hypothetical protein COT77_03140 [Candidatus Berkelbacteria bacterium CG10_big_fil_rev_8_21_14_0_10_41_12]|uniref:Uncharacterized protein n=1 Tax=Candidatus Berkelbacteria bacterium CG10_big_fil_rev_8_21_14_0_10_41_12 TaxID=1974513 RepID=A0A2M6WWF4_9BACT|nr:MAG: hypothetical protein COT77_03140 [Candidatus Berkelbacteria bacterium CG10_big_fil_rev_8_21_14_0_10_41_12]